MMRTKARRMMLAAVAVVIAAFAFGCSQHTAQNASSVPKAPPVANTAPGGGLPPGVGQPSANR
jgi:hypothetical protein